MKPFIETERLIIKPPSLHDMENVAKLYGNPDVMRYIGGAREYSASLQMCQKMIAHYDKCGFSSGDVYEKSTGQYVGRGGLVHLELNDTQPDVEIGYLFNPEHWGKGYATELAKAVVAWGFKNLSIPKLLGVVHPDNHASKNILCKKIKMKYARNEFHYNFNAEIYEIYKHEYQTFSSQS